MFLTVREVLKMREFREATLLAGKGGLDRLVHSATVLDAPDGVMFLKGNELALTTTYPLQHSLERLDLFVEELASRNVACLGVKLNRFITEIPESMLATANQLDFPILSLPNEKAWIEFINPIMSEVLNQRAKRLMRSEEIHNSFTKLLLSNASLFDLAQLLHHYSENPVSILHPKEGIAISIPEHFQLDNQVLQQSLSTSHTSVQTVESRHQLWHIQIDSHPYTVLPFHSLAEQEGYIIVKEENGKLNHEHIDCLLHAKNAISLKILQLRTEQENTKRHRSDFLLRLLHQQVMEQDILELKRKGWELGFELQDEYQATAITIKGSSFEQLYEEIDQIEHSLNWNKRVLAGLDKNNHIIVLFPTMDGQHHDQLQHQFSLLKNEIQKRHPAHLCSIGVSQQVNICSLPLAYHQALQALYHGVQLVGEGHIQYYDEMGMYRLFSHPALQDEVKTFVAELLEPLLDYDQTNQSHLTETLRIFLQNGGNFRETAKAMYIHHNTVRYRLDMIKKLTRRDVLHPTIRLQYQLALLLLQLQKGSTTEYM